MVGEGRSHPQPLIPFALMVTYGPSHLLACVSSPCQDMCVIGTDLQVRLEITSAPSLYFPLSWCRVQG